MDKFIEKLNDTILCLENAKQSYNCENKDYGKIAESLKYASLNLMSLAVINHLGEIKQDEKV